MDVCWGEKYNICKDFFFSDLCQWIFSGLISNSRQSFGGGGGGGGSCGV